MNTENQYEMNMDEVEAVSGGVSIRPIPLIWPPLILPIIIKALS